MLTVAEIRALAFELSVSERATLASRLLDPLPEILVDDDDVSTFIIKGSC